MLSSSSTRALALPRQRSAHRLLVAVLLTVLSVPFAPAPAAEAVDPWQQTVEIVFPTDPAIPFGDTYEACRSGCARIHQAADLMGPKMTPLYATVDGRICSINDEPEEDSYGRNLTICGDDGNHYRYLHINNDTPGTDDGAASLEHVYGPNIRHGVRVLAGQLVGYMGDSGNAENSGSHLHFDLYVPGVTNPWGEERINPYHSLVAAIAAGRVSDGKVVPREPTTRLSGDSRITTAIAVSQDAFDRADTVIIAASTVPHDALVAGPLAATLGGPVLLTDPLNLDLRTIEEVERLGASTVVLVGESAQLQAVVERLVDDLVVQVVGSADRFATSAAVAELVWAATGAGDPDAEVEVPLPVAPPAPSEPRLDMLDGDDWDGLWELNDPTLLLQLTRDQDGPTAFLDGAAFSVDDLSGERLRSWLVGVDPDDVDRVTFLLDGNEVNAERQWPYDLGGTAGRRGRSGIRLPNEGSHELTAVVHFLDDSTSTTTALFTILDGGDGGGDSDPTPDPDEPQPRRAIVAKGMDPMASRAWPDALAASWYGAARGLPVLLTSADGLPDAIAAALDGVDEVVIAGGPAAISADQADRIAAITGVEATRLFGADRYLTAAAIAEDLIDRNLARPSTVHIATGANWPDAVTAGAAVARQRGTLLLVDPGGASPSVRATFVAMADDIDDLVALGGTAAITSTALKNVAAWAV